MESFTHRFLDFNKIELPTQLNTSPDPKKQSNLVAFNAHFDSVNTQQVNFSKDSTIQSGAISKSKQA